MKKLKVGIIGQGRSGHDIHTHSLSLMPEMFEIAAVGDPLDDRMQDAAERFGAATYTDYRDLLKRDDLDLVVNASPSHLHVPITKEAFEAGRNVLCEKPLALNAADASQMCTVVEKSGVISMVGFVYRYYPAMLTVKRMIEHGELGEIYHFRGRISVFRLSNPAVSFEWRHDRARGGYGALSDLGSHMVDLARFLLDDDFAAVTGMGQIFIRTRKKPESDETAEVTAYDAATFSSMMRSGVLINIEVTRFAAGHTVFELDGSRASVRFVDGKLYKWQKDFESQNRTLSEFEEVNIEPESFDQREINLYAGFAGFVQKGIHASPDFREGLACQQILDAVDKSIREGGVVFLTG